MLQRDNHAVARVIRLVMTEFGAVDPNRSISNLNVDNVYDSHRPPKAAFFVVEHDGEVAGCGGMGPLQDGQADVCELRKMYFLEHVRGTGTGAKLLELILQAAREAGYRQCYLETLEHMEQARRLYRKYGFKPITTPMGNTGHTVCNFLMVRDL